MCSIALNLLEQMLRCMHHGFKIGTGPIFTITITNLGADNSSHNRTDWTAERVT
jgi:hypothetical protein